MNDPTGKAARFSACSSAAMKKDALSRLHRAVARAERACDLYAKQDHENAITSLKLLFCQ